MGLAPKFYVNDGSANVGYTEVPSTALNARKFAKAIPETNGAKSFFETKASEDGKGASLTLRYLVSKTFEVLGPDAVLRPAKVNLTVVLPATSPSVNRQAVLTSMLSQVVSFITTNPATIDSSDGADTITLYSDRVGSILNGEI